MYFSFVLLLIKFSYKPFASVLGALFFEASFYHVIHSKSVVRPTIFLELSFLGGGVVKVT